VDADPFSEREHRINIPGTKTQYRQRRGVRVEPWAVARLRDAIQGKKPTDCVVSGVSAGMMSDRWELTHNAAGYPNYWLRDLRHSYAVRALLQAIRFGKSANG